MYGSLLTFLIAIVIQALAPHGKGAPWSLVEAAYIACFPVGVWLALRGRFRRLMARALHDQEPHKLRVSFSGLIPLYQAMLLAPFALLLYATEYAAWFLGRASAESAVLGGFVGLAPFIVFVLILWWEAYPLQGVLFGRSGTRFGFVLSHARMELPVLAPWFVLLGLLDLLRRGAPAAYRALEANPLLQLLYLPVFLLLLGIFLPVLVKAMWGCQPMPAGPLRDRLEALSERLGLKVGEILYWPLLQGKVLTAGIVGLLPRFRYLLITPALVEALSPAEIDGVVAHEAGHVRHRHLWFYLLFFLGYVALVPIFLRGAEAALTWWQVADPELVHRPHANQYAAAATTLGLIGVLFFYFRYVFGAVSRAFERQADAYALTSLGEPLPLISALERISVYSGDIRDLPSWHHGSIAERVDFLANAARDPSVLARHRRRVRWMQGLFAVAVACLISVSAALYSKPVDRQVNLVLAEHALRHRLVDRPEDAAAWLALAQLYQEGGDERRAEEAYLEVIRIAPRRPEALNNLAWLYATTRDEALRRPERALALAELAAQLDPSPHILDTLAEARYQVRDYRGALSAIELALSLDPPNRGYYLTQRQKFQEGLPEP
jgi:Zn-dependent protease with chaperone function